MVGAIQCCYTIDNEFFYVILQYFFERLMCLILSKKCKKFFKKIEAHTLLYNIFLESLWIPKFYKSVIWLVEQSGYAILIGPNNDNLTRKSFPYSDCLCCIHGVSEFCKIDLNFSLKLIYDKVPIKLNVS